jgi:hypothetical protein
MATEFLQLNQGINSANALANSSPGWLNPGLLVQIPVSRSSARVVSLLSNPGLKLANAFGLFITRL